MNQRTILDEPAETDSRSSQRIEPNSDTPDDTPYRCTDLAVAAFLMARGFTLTAVEPSPVAGSRRRIFVFPGAAAAVAPTFFTGGQVPARVFANAFRDLKAILFPRDF